MIPSLFTVKFVTAVGTIIYQLQARSIDDAYDAIKDMIIKGDHILIVNNTKQVSFLVPSQIITYTVLRKRKEL